MYFKGKILIEEPGAPNPERLSIVEADNIREAYAKLIHTYRQMAAGVAPEFVDGKVIFRHGRVTYTIVGVERTTLEGFMFEHLLVCHEWWGETDYAEEALAHRGRVGKVTF